MSRTIVVRNDTTQALAGALQEALTTVVTPANIKTILSDPSDSRRYQHVHPRGDSPALGTVSMLAISPYHDFTINVVMGFGGVYHPKLPVVQALGQRGKFCLTVGGSPLQTSFVFRAHEYRATVTIPSRLSAVVSGLRIEYS